MNRLIVVFFLVVAPLTAQAVQNVHLRAEFINENWYPLSVSDMKSAAVDSFISRLSEGQDFYLYRLDEPMDDYSLMMLTVRLVEPAETAKMIAHWQHQQVGSVLVESTLSLSDMTREQIYQAFSQMGHETAERMSDLVDEKSTQEIDPKMLLKMDESERVEHEVVWDNGDPVSTQQQINLAAHFKREGYFEQAYATLRNLYAMPDITEAEKAAIGHELFFELPVYEADALIMNINKNAPKWMAEGRFYAMFDQIKANLERSLQYYESDFKKSSQINSRLNLLFQVKQSTERLIKTQLRNEYASLRPLLMEAMFSQGSLTPEQLVQALPKRMLGDDYSVSQSGDVLTLTIRTPQQYYVLCKVDTGDQTVALDVTGDL